MLGRLENLLEVRLGANIGIVKQEFAVYISSHRIEIKRRVEARLTRYEGAWSRLSLAYGVMPLRMVLDHCT
jgi:hypothetical protein